MEEIAATGFVPAPPDTVFEFLADLENHWRLAGRFIEVDNLDRPPGEPGSPAIGARVSMRGPLGLSRTAQTQVVVAVPSSEIRGTARVGRRTRAEVRWELRPEAAGTRVALSAVVASAGPLDRALLAIGGRRWLTARFHEVVGRLARAVVSLPDARRRNAGSPISPL